MKVKYQNNRKQITLPIFMQNRGGNMKIMIKYESSWRNSFLNGDNNSELPKKGRGFVGSMTSLKKPENFIKREVSIDTVMGVLNRLIGDQQKLYQARSEKYCPYYFKDIEHLVKFEDKPIITNEMTYVRNITGSTDQNSYTGMIKTNDQIFESDYSARFWGVLFLERTELCEFIINGKFIEKKFDLSPLAIMARLEEIKKEKPVESKGEVFHATTVLHDQFKKYKSLNKKGQILILPLYCSALYMQLHRLEMEYNIDSAKSPKGGISGISNNGYTPKDFMDKYTTGDKKKIWGNPYKREEFIKKQGKVVSLMSKASGQLDVEISVERKKALELKSMVENAGVSSFYLGKKGLAYVSKIRI